MVSLPTSSRPRAPQCGFTLVELLIVITIIALLIALAVGAATATIETTRRATCMSRLRDVGTALAAHHTAKGAFPPGGVEWRPMRYRGRPPRQLAWSAFLLPYLGRSDVYDGLDLTTPYDSRENATGGATVISTYLCPSTPRTSLTIDGLAVCDYGGIYGERITGPNSPPKGAMIYDRALSLAHITDSHRATLIVAEDASWTDGQWINGRNLFDQAFPINAAPPYENDIGSNHPGGAQGLMVSGTVRFLEESMDLRILAALCTRAGGEPADAFEGP